MDYKHLDYLERFFHLCACGLSSLAVCPLWTSLAVTPFIPVCGRRKREVGCSMFSHRKGPTWLADWHLLLNFISLYEKVPRFNHSAVSARCSWVCISRQSSDLMAWIKALLLTWTVLRHDTTFRPFGTRNVVCQVKWHAGWCTLTGPGSGQVEISTSLWRDGGWGGPWHNLCLRKEEAELGHQRGTAKWSAWP